MHTLSIDEHSMVMSVYYWLVFRHLSTLNSTEIQLRVRGKQKGIHILDGRQCVRLPVSQVSHDRPEYALLLQPQGPSHNNGPLSTPTRPSPSFPSLAHCNRTPVSSPTWQIYESTVACRCSRCCSPVPVALCRGEPGTTPGSPADASLVGRSIHKQLTTRSKSSASLFPPATRLAPTSTAASPLQSRMVSSASDLSRSSTTSAAPCLPALLAANYK